ncbi:MAG TPA: serine/threonine-protein kinase [Pirellulales bacterium]
MSKSAFLPLDATLDSPTPEPSSNLTNPCARVELVRGSGPHIATETTNLLRIRLRGAALSLLIGFGAFFLWRLTDRHAIGQPGTLLFYADGAVLCVLGFSLLSLCRQCGISQRRLRYYEILIFATPALYLLLVDYQRMTDCAEHGFLQQPVASWYALIFTYALFIPNSWRRAALVVGSLAAAPILLVAVLWMQNGICSKLLHDHPTYLVEVGLMLGLTVVTSVYGTHMVGALRREAFEARRLGQYRLLRLIGSGGMGDVYLAEHRMMKRPCAIKVIHPSKADDPQALARFEREVHATAQLSHWNSIEIFDYGQAEDGTFYYVMEYLPGLSLSQLVDRHGPLPPARIVYLLAQVCDALAEAHAAGLIHRDIKPGNIFSAVRGGQHDVAKLLDFGLAKPLAVADDRPAQLTQAGAITGSPLYMSPEQAVGESEPDARSDVYSLGAVAYFLLTGAPPFTSDQPLKVIMAHVSQEVVPPSRLRGGIPADLEAVVLRCLAKAPGDRFQDVDGVAAALAECSVAGQWNREQAADWWQSELVHPTSQRVEIQGTLAGEGSSTGGSDSAERPAGGVIHAAEVTAGPAR